MLFHRGFARRLIIAGHELASQQLADRRFWNLRNKHVAARALEVCQPRVAAEGVEIVGLYRRAWLDESAYDLAPALVRQSKACLP